MLLPLSFVSPGFVSDGFIVMSTILPCLDSFPPWRRSVGKRRNTHTSHHWEIQTHHTEKYTFTTGWNTNTPHGEIQIHHTEKYFSYHNFTNSWKKTYLDTDLFSLLSENDILKFVCRIAIIFHIITAKLWKKKKQLQRLWGDHNCTTAQMQMCNLNIL